MKRFTKKVGERFMVLPGAVIEYDGAYTGPAIEKLGRFETLMDGLLHHQLELTEELEQLRRQGKERSVRFREAFGKKMIYSQLFALLQLHGEDEVK